MRPAAAAGGDPDGPPDHRPRAGLLRVRDFVMKDSYSFTVDDAGLDEAYEAHRAAYERIFQRLGLEYVIVAADNGLMGGARSEEFLHPTPVGEDTFVRSAGGYAANVEAVAVRPPAPISYADAPAAHAEDTPDTPTIQMLVDHLNDTCTNPAIVNALLCVCKLRPLLLGNTFAN